LSDLSWTAILERMILRAAAPSREQIGGGNEDNMSVFSIGGSISLKRTREDKDSLSDSDIENRPYRGHKVLRLRVIGSDSDGPAPIVLSDSSDNVSTKVRGKRSRVRNRDTALDTSAELANLVFSDYPSRLACEDLACKDVNDLQGTALAWLKDMELIRTKSKKLNGSLSGCLKDRIACVRSIIKTLVDRVKDSGDVSYLRRRNDELAAQVRESKKEESRLQDFLKEANAKAEKFSMEVFEFRRRIGSKSASVESEKFPPLPSRNKQETSNKSGTPKRERNTRRGSSVMETLQNCDDRLVTISKFDEKIVKFEELLMKMKNDLYGSMEAIAEKVNKTTCCGPPPPNVGSPELLAIFN